jgi:hypothetical protein
MKATAAAGDREMLQAIFDSGRCPRNCEDAFEEMAKRLRNAARATLTDKQRAWVREVYHALELDADHGATNDVSSGRVAPASEPMRYDAMGPKVLTPPPLRRPGVGYGR